MILLSSQHWADEKNIYRLTPHAETLNHEFVSSRLDYCNSRTLWIATGTN